MKRMALLAGLLSLFAAIPATAQVGSDWSSGGFQTYGGQESPTSEMDADRDFSTADQDGDGGLTPEELKAYHEEKGTPAPSFSDTDVDGDGKVNSEEFKAAPAVTGEEGQ